MTLPRLAIVGDVHGNAVGLEALLSDLPRWERPVVFLGDYVDHGPDARRVLDLLVNFAHSDVVFLEGNHDAALREFLEGAPFSEYASRGGLATLASYLKEPGANVARSFAQGFPHAHRKFLDHLRPCYEVDGLLVSHMGHDPDQPQVRSREAMVLRPHPSLLSAPHDPGFLTVCGHYQPHATGPLRSATTICLDTGSGLGGPLTALLLPELTFLPFGSP